MTVNNKLMSSSDISSVYSAETNNKSNKIWDKKVFKIIYLVNHFIFKMK